ncbi:hypothetical protein RvY_06724 [Ramazzottius varieornatus]|uniref:Uncharacterized protein n=1 Tax=Ramazzottius varieornatus TaxID=947166 RepID=A0A1D1UZZ0_RAMVA|nr:hypothetical protein RvY_06724 [Ramazzottius varieornatus]
MTRIHVNLQQTGTWETIKPMSEVQPKVPLDLCVEYRYRGSGPGDFVSPRLKTEPSWWAGGSRLQFTNDNVTAVVAELAEKLEAVLPDVYVALPDPPQPIDLASGDEEEPTEEVGKVGEEDGDEEGDHLSVELLMVDDLHSSSPESEEELKKVEEQDGELPEEALPVQRVGLRAKRRGHRR